MRSCIIMALVVGFWGVGCNHNGVDLAEMPERLGLIREPPDAAAQQLDLPVPSEFELANEYHYVAEGMRVIRSLYAGPGKADHVKSFYLRAMPKHGWQFMGETTGSQGVSWEFRKAHESCWVRFREQARENYLELRVDYIPAAQR